MMTEAERAYAAGIIDGEGSISLAIHHGTRTRDGSRPSNAPMAMVQVTMCEPQAVAWLHARWGGHLVRMGKRQAHHKQATGWRLYSQHAAAFLREIQPFLLVKQAQANLAIAATEGRAPSRKIGEARMRELFAMRDRMLELNGTTGRAKHDHFFSASTAPMRATCARP